MFANRVNTCVQLVARPRMKIRLTMGKTMDYLERQIDYPEQMENPNLTRNNKNCIILFPFSSVAQWKRAGPITQRSQDRNLPLLLFTRFSSVGRAWDCSGLSILLNIKFLWSLVRIQQARHFRQCGRVVKAVDQKSTGLCPRRFKSCRCRFLDKLYRFSLIYSVIQKLIFFSID